MALTRSVCVGFGSGRSRPICVRTFTLSADETKILGHFEDKNIGKNA